MTKFYKYHALGNDYLVLDPKEKFPLYNKDDIIRICHRNFGLGSDGILYGPLKSTCNADFRMEIWNPDGSQAEKSGNGLRIFCFYLFDQKLVSSYSNFTIETLGGIANCCVNEKEGTATVDIGKASFDSTKIPVTGDEREVLNETITVCSQKFTYHSVSVGNPHVVVPLPDISKEIACKIGPFIEENTELFPNRTNVQFLKVLDRNNIQIEIWERGAGYTLASGTSSSASAAVAHKIGACDNNITVHCPGGKIQITISSAFEITMTASVTRVGIFTLSQDIFSFQV